MTETDVRIRRYRVGDAAAAAEAIRESMADVQPWMPWCHPGYSAADSRAWIEVQVPSFDACTAFEFVIESAAGQYLGGCGLNQIDAINQRANLGYWVRSSAAGRGVATAAVRALRDWAFTRTDLIRLEIVVAVGNAASLRVAERAGALREGVLRHRMLLHGTAVDAVMLSIVRSPS